jgi:flagellar biosynthetic protein FlhB
VSAPEKTEKATPKRRDEAREKGQVARSTDLNGAVVLLAAVVALGAFGPGAFDELAGSMRQTLRLAADPEAVSGPGLASILRESGWSVIRAAGPIAVVCLVAGVLVNVAQVRLRLTPKALLPDPKRLNPLQGAKNIFGINAMFESGKTLAKVAVVGAVVAAAVLPEIPRFAALVGMPPADLLAFMARTVQHVAQRAALAYIVIAVADVLYQRHRFEKQLRMDPQEVKREQKDQNVPPEVRAALRRRAMQAARARMMAAVPTADVVVTNPTHYAVALRYEGGTEAPEVVAKGKDLVAMQIRRVAGEHGVPIVPNPPLARSLHAAVEVGHQIPEELFAAVAQVLAFVYRTAGRRSA